ncbi:MAG: hypothetical protein K6A41_10860 [Bacteroidales bacterium]|nr:hypothetical protein [Bacteroidales bacterium]
MNNDFRMSQGQLRYLYDSAKGRMAYHPDYTEKCQNIVDECPRFESEKEATKMAMKMEKEHPDGTFRVWATLEKDEEFYRINAPWIVTTNGDQMKAAEYIGMVTKEEVYILIQTR